MPGLITSTIKFSRRSESYKIVAGEGALAATGEFAAESAPGARRAAVISNRKVFGLYGDVALKNLENAGFRTSVWLMGDGERFKNLRSLEKSLDFLNASGIERTDIAVALGGGVVGDLAGFSAAVHLRGIRYLQVPTTLLAMIDSAVGGKTGVNTKSGKNLAGAFHQPSGVVADISTLATLEPRELSAGLFEAVKHATLAGGRLFETTGRFLTEFPLPLRKRLFEDPASTARLRDLVTANIKFKASVVAADEREETSGKGSGSRKILNFGHTFAHALEKALNYRVLKHGEAVGYGILMAAELSKKLDILSVNELNLLNDVVHRCGALPRPANIGTGDILDAFRYDKKNVSGSLQFILLNGIGEPVIISQENIPQTALKKAIEKVLTR